MLYIIIYNDKNDKTISRLYITRPIFLEVGSTNGYDWQVITIQELYETSFYRKETILKMIEEKENKINKRNSLIRKIIQAIDIVLN